ncbi:MAG: ComF family protein [Proteobacteria bacterium]|nr:MAG: ComF family protein [Pseudomonadota bacterium]
MPAFDASVAALGYRYPVPQLVHRLKFHGDLGVARLLGVVLAERVKSKYGDDLPDLIVPVPLHARRLARRGFNQSIEIARVVSRELNVPFSTAGASRTKNTEPQRTLPLAERRRNVRKGFVAATTRTARSIALLDDVMTTGATLDALAGAFKHLDNPQVHCWVCARA